MPGTCTRHPVFALLFAFAVTGYVQRTSVGITGERIMPELGLSPVELSWLFTAFLFTYSVFQIPGALIGETIGARRMLPAKSLWIRVLRGQGFNS